MKKLLTLILLSTLLFACSSSDDPIGPNGGGGGNGTTTQLGKTTTPIAASEWKGYANDPKAPNYIGEGKSYITPILGDWVLTHENGNATNRFLAFRFTFGGGWYSILTKPAVNQNPNFTNVLIYEYNSTQIREVKTGIIYTYTTAADLSTMSLFDGSNTWTFKKYDNNGVWEWKGDWNDTYSPYYAVYNGKYNPVKGEWKLVSDNGYISIQDRYFDFRVNQLLYQKNSYFNESYTFHTKYEINDTSIKATTQSFLGYATHKYWILGDTLYMQGVNASNKLQEISKLVKVK